MKRGIYSLMLGAAVVFLASCGSSKEVTEAKKKEPAGEKLITVYCSGPEFFSTDGYIRANSIGESSDMTMAKKKARNNTLQELSSKIQTTFKAVIDNYQSSKENSSGEEVVKRYEELSREVINQTISGYRTICEKVTQTEKGTYKTYLAFEISIENLSKPFYDKISEDDKLRIDYDYEKFKKTFNEEMKKLD
ncbi:MAG: LPP20 family lipoprotein [Bacteroidales bacterium]|jgi:hypothetical protein|nr:LPP20 family lipoprotein [Bacteroidales bacterium]